MNQHPANIYDLPTRGETKTVSTRSGSIVRQHILNSAHLPVLPAIAVRLLEVTAQDDGAHADVVHLISQDVALTAKILKVANSSFYGFQNTITSVAQAVSLLGINSVRNLVLSFSFLSLGHATASNLFDYYHFWEQSLAGATACRLIASFVPHVDPDDLFTIGLLQNIGQLVFALTMPANYNHVLERLSVGGKDSDVVAIENEYLSLDHTQSGAEIARVWGLPPIIQTAICNHHAPECFNGGQAKEHQVVNIVYLADLVTRIFYASTPEQHHARFYEDAQRLLKLDGLAIKHFLAGIHCEIEKAAEYFNIQMEPIRPVADILQEANIRLSVLNLSYEEMNRQLTQARSDLEFLRRQLDERNLLLERLVNLDALTEVYNHRYFQQFLHSEINRAAINNSSLSLLMVDIDKFKRFNDTFGHQAGDFILRELCGVIQQAIREYDLLARYGGEEFVVVLPGSTNDAAMLVANRICEAVANHDFFENGQHYRVTISIGAASLAPGETTWDQNHFITMADKALFASKNRGGNVASLYSPASPSKMFAF